MKRDENEPIQAALTLCMMRGFTGSADGVTERSDYGEALLPQDLVIKALGLSRSGVRDLMDDGRLREVVCSDGISRVGGWSFVDYVY